MSDQTEGRTPQSPGQGKLYDAQGQMIEPQVHTQRSGIEQITDFTREQPIIAVLLAFGVGYFVGKIL